MAEEKQRFVYLDGGNADLYSGDCGEPDQDNERVCIGLCRATFGQAPVQVQVQQDSDFRTAARILRKMAWMLDSPAGETIAGMQTEGYYQGFLTTGFGDNGAVGFFAKDKEVFIELPELVSA